MVNLKKEFFMKKLNRELIYKSTKFQNLQFSKKLQSTQRLWFLEAKYIVRHHIAIHKQSRDNIDKKNNVNYKPDTKQICILPIIYCYFFRLPA